MWSQRLLVRGACCRALSNFESTTLCARRHRPFSKKAKQQPPAPPANKKGAATARRKPTTSTAPIASPPAAPASVDPRIQARPPGEKEVKTKFPLPKVDKEKELGALQSEIVDLYRSSNYRPAVALSMELLASTEKHFGADHPATASAHNNLGLLHKQLGDYDESRRQYKKALAIYKRAVGPDHASYASALHNLGTCARAQLHLDSSLRATDRLSLLQESADSLETAYSVRLQELGPDHPHTVASLSSWGATLASQVLSHYKKSQDQWVATISSSISDQGWQAADRHLRRALQTAIDNPRGPNIHKSKKPPRKQDPSAAAASSPSATPSSITTLSGAAAGQNMAVFLKARAVTETPPNRARFEEARRLYEQVLQVRARLLPATHADLVATQHSLAELLEATGDAAGANAIRQTILDAYDEPDDGGGGSGTGGGCGGAGVVNDDHPGQSQNPAST